MELPHDMTTLSEAMEKARKKGYENDFQMTDKGFMCKQTDEYFKPQNLKIVKVYRFEGVSNPDDMSILYLIEADNGTKGMFIDAFGTYGDYDAQDLAEFLKQVETVR